MPETRPSPHDNLAKLRQRARSRGVAEVARLGWSRLRENLWSHETLLMMVRQVDAAEALGTELEVRRAGPGDGALYARDIGTETPQTFAARLTATTWCLLVLEADRVLHSSWVTSARAWTRELRGYLAPPAGDVYVYESFTRADTRGRGIYPLALHHICAAARTEGAARVWVGVEAGNAPSVKAIGKAGFERAFSYRYGRRLGLFRLDAVEGPLETEGRAFLRPG